MTAPAPSPYEQEQIDRFGIFDEEERVVEEVINRSLDSDDPNDWTPRALAAAAVAAYRAQDGATCGDLAPTIVPGLRVMCELPHGHGGAHQHDNGDGLPPTRWVLAQDSGAEEAVRRVSALAEELESEADEHATYQRRYSEAGDRFGAVVSEREAWTSRHAADRIRAALAPQADR